MQDTLLQEFEVLLYGPFGELVKITEESSQLYEKAKEEFRKLIGKKVKGVRLVRAVFALMDNLAREYAKNKDVACKPGCAYCCFQMVCCTTIEMQLIAEWLKSRPRERTLGILQSAWEKAVPMQKYLNELQEERKPETWKEIGDELRKQHLMRPCPFLDEKELLCNIYPVRPTDCRGAYVIGMSCGTTGWTRSKLPKTFFAQAACDIISKEDMRIRGIMQVIPLFSWVLLPEFINHFQQ